MQNLTINTNINFGGFYESIHSDVIDTYIEMTEYNWEQVDYKNTYETYAKDYIKVINNILDTNISFKALNSPKYYNYSTDSINVEITKKDILDILVECLFDAIIENLQDDIVEELQANYLEIVFNEDN